MIFNINIAIIGHDINQYYRVNIVLDTFRSDMILQIFLESADPWNYGSKPIV